MQSQVQYQHYIPQFILRNFSHTYKPPKQKKPQKNGQPRQKGEPRKGDKVLNVVDLTSDEPKPREALVTRWFGQDNMYNDSADAIENRKNIEHELSRLEGRVATILQKVKVAHEKGESGLSLDRSERNWLRKFLFIMKYRGPGFYGKYISGDFSSYVAEDKNLLLMYMVEKGFKNPRDVWLHNLRAILDLEMDAEGKWMAKLKDNMFPADAGMFVYHVQSSYMAFLTPANPDEEFILTDQCYNLFEGPTHETVCHKTGEYLGSLYACFHEFGPISSRLIIVLRSFALPSPLEDANPKMRKARETIMRGVAAQFPKPENVKSILADLPIEKATNSYTRVVNGRLEPGPRWAGRFHRNDKFHFRFWPIEKSHVDIINSIFLDNLLRCKSIVFHSLPAFTKTLETYLTSNSHGFKTVGVGETFSLMSRRTCLEKLSLLLKALGSDKTPLWCEDEKASKVSHIQSVDDLWLDMMKAIYEGDMRFAGPEASTFLATYSALGGTERTFIKDLEQSWRLYKLETLVWNSSGAFHGHIRARFRKNFLDFILQIPPRRVWLYVKHLRWMLSDEYAMHMNCYVGIAPILAAKARMLLAPGPEDDVVRANKSARPESLTALIHIVGLSNIFF